MSSFPDNHLAFVERACPRALTFRSRLNLSDSRFSRRPPPFRTLNSNHGVRASVRAVTISTIGLSSCGGSHKYSSPAKQEDAHNIPPLPSCTLSETSPVIVTPLDDAIFRHYRVAGVSLGPYQ